MPTLIRILVVLIVLAGIAFAGMVALTLLVDPGQKEMRVKIPARDLGVESESDDPLGLRNPAPALDVELAPAPVAEPAPAEPAPDAPAGETTIVDIPE